jgi:hypothetical protein
MHARLIKLKEVMDTHTQKRLAQAAFQGFQSPNTTPVPDELFDNLLPLLSGAELKVLLYVIRRTFGFKKGSDRISKSQLENGIKKADGSILDGGTGLSRRAIRLAIDSLVGRNVLIKLHNKSPERGHEATEYALNISNTPPWVKSTQGVGYKVPKPLGRGVPPQQTGKQDINYSNIRKAKSDDFASGNSHSREEEPEAITLSPPGNGGISKKRQLYKNTEAVSLPTNGQTNLRAVEGLKAIEKYRRSAAKRYVNSSPLSTREPQRGGDVSHIGQTLQGKQSLLALPPRDEEAQEAIKSYVRDIAPKLHDEAPLTSSTTRAYNLYQRAGIDLSRFFNLLYDAEKEANRRSTTITKLTVLGFKNRMAYFFAVLEDKLGLRHHHAASVSSG